MSPREVIQKQVPGKGKGLILIIARVVFLICFYTSYLVIREKMVSFHLKKNVILVKRFWNEDKAALSTVSEKRGK